MSTHKCEKCNRLHLVEWKNNTKGIETLVVLKCEVFLCDGLVINQMSKKEIKKVDVQSISLGAKNGVNENVKNFHLDLEK